MFFPPALVIGALVVVLCVSTFVSRSAPSVAHPSVAVTSVPIVTQKELQNSPAAILPPTSGNSLALHSSKGFTELQSGRDATAISCDFFNHLTPKTIPTAWRVYQRQEFFARLHRGRMLGSVDIVIARCKEPLDWIDELVAYSFPKLPYRVFVYEKCLKKGDPPTYSAEWDSAHHATHVLLPNVGFNDMAYLTHWVTIDHATLSDATLLLTGDPFAETCDLFNTTRKLIADPSPGFYSLGRLYRKIQCDYLSVTEVYKRVLHANCHAWISTYLHSHWFITKPRILAVDRQVFQRMLETVNGHRQPTCMYPTQKPQVMKVWHELKQEGFYGPVHSKVGRKGQDWHSPELIARHRYDAEVVERMWSVMFLEGPRMPIDHGFAAEHAQGKCTRGGEINATESAIDLGHVRFCPQCGPQTPPNMKAVEEARRQVDEYFRSLNCTAFVTLQSS